MLNLVKDVKMMYYIMIRSLDPANLGNYVSIEPFSLLKKNKEILKNNTLVTRFDGDSILDFLIF